MSYFLHINHLTFSYENSPSLFEDLNLTFPEGWTGIAGANGTGKSTLLKLISGVLNKQNGEIRLGSRQAPPSMVYIPQEEQREDAFHTIRESFREDLDEGNSTAYRWLGLLKVEYNWFYRRETLSYGERKRLDLAAALCRDPDCLCLDEPVNHLDEDARTLIAAALADYKGIGLLVSHDRYLLNRLPGAILFLTASGPVFRHGNYQQALAEQEKEELSRRRNRDSARKEVKKLEAEAVSRRELSASAHKRRSKKNLNRHDSDGRAKLDLVRISGKDGTGGKLLRQMDGRLKQAQEKLISSEYHTPRPTGITIGSSLIKRDFIYRQDPEFLYLNTENRNEGWLALPALEIRPGDRICLNGRNGAGKSTLIHHMQKGLDFRKIETIYLPQEFTEKEQYLLKEEFQKLPPSRLGEVLSTIARLGSDPVAVRESKQFSPGEARKLFLAISLTRPLPAEFLILDEPENHLDLPAVSFLEEALAGYGGTLLLVSHDREFHRRLTRISWDIRREGENRQLVVHS